MHEYTKERIKKILKAIIIIAVIVMIRRWFSYTYGMESKQRYLEEHAFEYVTENEETKLIDYISDNEYLAQDLLDKEHQYGYEEGTESGYDTGYDDGYEEGKIAGAEENYDEAWDEGYTKGYNDGYTDGEL